FKKGETTFTDTLYQTIGTQSGAAQVGLGVGVGNVSQNFSDGSLETTGNSTDLAIGGDGFFVVSQAGSDETYYTRAGDFSFDETGALVTPDGYILQGWEVDEDGDAVGAITDLILTAFTSSPSETEEITLVTNLDADSDSNSTVLSNVYDYDSDDTTAVSSDTYEYQSVVTVYDSLGASHEITVYYDKKSDTEWEYVIACDPDEDNRNLVQDTTSQGLLARGTIEFSESSGDIVNMTMEEFSGRVGNVSASGSNAVDDISFEIEDSEAMLLDGYGIEMSFDGDNWVLDEDSLPENYENAEVIYSDDQTIHILLDPDSSGGETEADLKIQLDQTAMAGDTISFDINDTTDLHVQNLSNTDYDGDTANNTTVEINDPGVMTRDAEDISIVWNPVEETWYWSNPETAADEGTLVSDLTTSDATAVSTDTSNVEFSNASALVMTVDDVNLYYNGTTGAWDWNEELKDEDISGLSNTLDPSNEVSVTTVEGNGVGAMATDPDIELTWDGSSWSVTEDGGLTVSVVAAESGDDQVQILITDASGEDATITMEFDETITTAGGQTVSFGIDPTPPDEYADAQILDNGDNSVAIDFDGDDAIDMTINVTSGATTALAGGETFSFSVDADIPPEEYSDAILAGDETQAVIDLDGSGDEDDAEDIIFDFTDDLRTGTDTSAWTDRSSITFDIEGSSVWRTCDASEAEDTGYYQFTVDFLGGEFGSTETDISFNIGTEYDGSNWETDSLSTTQYASSSSTTYQDADGYTAGDLTGVEVSSDGLITGTYSNGQSIDLFMVALADFYNPNGLTSEGGNLYAATDSSGAAITNQAGENGLGELSSYTLEMSNVDVSDEFVDMIELQNAYEANAKIITTVDEMLDTVIGMKR
ncbi:MAG: flagellar hook-basal body complex protein, partial [Desulfobacterales bacterium]|nr:flagellar hook-basal body complex protein [Desulfobacterales bacterium]